MFMHLILAKDLSQVMEENSKSLGFVMLGHCSNPGKSEAWPTQRDTFFVSVLVSHFGDGCVIVPKSDYDKTKNYLKAQSLRLMMQKLTGKQVRDGFSFDSWDFLFSTWKKSN